MTPNYDTQLNAGVQLEDVTKSLRKLEDLQHAVSLIEAFNTIKKLSSQAAFLRYGWWRRS
jgi:hypothetical protein